MDECDISNSDLATAFTASSMDEAAVGGTDLKKRKTHRLKQRFQVVKKLGQGTYGKVQLAINNETGQKVAIKTIKKNKVSNQQDLVRIRREIQIMSSINHPNIIHIFEVFENKDKIVLVMQYASGGELYDHVSLHKVLNDNEARRVFRQIATAIYYCHKNKICHRDLKLENILLDEKGNAKIADFGLSNVFDQKHFLQTFCGSPLYASPEIVRGLPYYGPEVDCWSLGVLLYTLVYGAMPFDGSNFKKLVKQISEASYFEPPEKSSASGLIQRLLTPDPKERATIIDICTDEWVNAESEHSLLQVAEDLSNLTNHAVRLDMLLTLAPNSPTAAHPTEPVTQNAESSKPEENVGAAAVANKRPIENTSFGGSGADVPTNKKGTKKRTKKSEQKDSTTNKSTESAEPVRQDESKELEPRPPAPEAKDKQEEATITKPEESTEQQRKSSLENQEQDTAKMERRKSQTPSVGSNESSSSISKRPGRVSIPKIWDSDQQQQQDGKQPQSPTTAKIRKEPISPGAFSVSELKKELELKTTKQKATNNIIKRRGTLADASEILKLKLDNDGGEPTSNSSGSAKKYKNRSLSLNLVSVGVGTAKIDEVKESGDLTSSTVPVQQQQPQPETKNDPASGGSPLPPPPPLPEKGDGEEKTSSKNSSTSSVTDKSMAKQIIQKNIAKAKLMEKRQTSLSSGETTPLISIENSTISSMVQSPAIGSSSNVFFKKLQNNGESRANDLNVPANPAPISRSYKKVIFTKDGAKITETGKFYSHEGEDGVTTRVERKSRVTHIINNGSGTGAGTSTPTGSTTFNIQRSDSQDSTGSVDIFDDIFDDHWTGENLFSNVKSLFGDFFGSSRLGYGGEKKSLRSRAESLERTNLLPERSSFGFDRARRDSKLSQMKADHGGEKRTATTADNSGVFGSQKSLFSSRSIFSSNSSSFAKSGFGKEVDDLISSTRSKFDDYKNYALDRFQSGDNNKSGDIFGRSGRESIFADDDDDEDTPHRRIEQWLDRNESKTDFDQCMNTYGTMMRPRRYSRTMTTSSNDLRLKSDILKKVEISSSSSSCQVVRQSKTSTVSRTSDNVVPRNADIELNFSFGDLGAGNLTVNQVSVLGNETKGFGKKQTIDSELKIDEPSSLLEQLRTVGYKKLVDRRLSDSSSTEDLANAAASATNKSTSSVTVKSQSSATISSSETITTASSTKIGHRSHRK